VGNLKGKTVIIAKEDINWRVSKKLIGKIGVVVYEECGEVTIDFGTKSFDGGEFLWKSGYSTPTHYRLSGKCVKVIGL
jgi:hypothetical protein